MGVYIKGMEMPRNCAECFFHKVFPATGVGINQLYCALCGINIVKLSDAQPDCPLVPIPPHGRLGDLDKLADNMRSATAGMEHRAIIMHEIRRATTIVPAEEGES